MRTYLPLSALLFLVGCGEEPAAAPKPPISQLQRDINATEAASAVGYDGEALKQSVQEAVDAQQQHNAQTAAAQESASP